MRSGLPAWDATCGGELGLVVEGISVSKKACSLSATHAAVEDSCSNAGWMLSRPSAGNPRRGTQSFFKGALAACLVLGSASTTLSACTIERDTNHVAEVETQSSAPKPPEKLAPAVSVRDGETGVDPTEKIVVRSQGDGLKSVVMTNENGYQVESKLSEDGRRWENAEVLGYYRTYTLKAVDKNGKTTELTFNTQTPNGTAAVALAPLEGSTVGVGQTISMRFGYPIADREAAQNAIEITTDPPVDGAFYWLNNYEVRWRPKNFWAPGTKVTVKAKIYGKNLGDGIYGESDNETSFTIGDDVRAVVDDRTHMMTVSRNGEVLRTIPVSLGSGKWPTPNGTYIIGDKHKELIMDSETYGLPHDEGGYRVKVKYATQMSYSGIYVHGAPWSVWAQGNTNTSHGCVNVTDDIAQWFQETVKAGDVVIVQHTVGGELSGFDGLGDWNIPWTTWSAGNARVSTGG